MSNNLVSPKQKAEAFAHEVSSLWKAVKGIDQAMGCSLVEVDKSMEECIQDHIAHDDAIMGSYKQCAEDLHNAIHDAFQAFQKDILEKVHSMIPDSEHEKPEQLDVVTP